MSDTVSLDAVRLRALVRYDVETGQIFWRNPVRNQKHGPLGAPAGHGGRLQTPMLGRAHYVHRLVWLYHHGRWPVEQIDHINGDKTDNRIENLREAGSSENVQNRWVGNRGSRAGLIGVSYDGRKTNATKQWRARIQIGGRMISLGYYDTPTEAHEAYLAAKERLHPFWSGHRVAG